MKLISTKRFVDNITRDKRVSAIKTKLLKLSRNPGFPPIDLAQRWNPVAGVSFHSQFVRGFEPGDTVAMVRAYGLISAYLASAFSNEKNVHACSPHLVSDGTDSLAG